MSGRVGSITTDIIADGLVFNMDPANRASTIPSTSTDKTFNTLNLAESGSFINDTIYDSSTITPSYALDGAGDVIKCSTFDLSTLSSWSAGCWFKTTSTGWESMIEWATASNTRSGIGIAGSSGKMIIVYPTSKFTYCNTTTVRDGNWYYGVGTWDGSTPLGYINGIVETMGSTGAGASGATTTGEIFIGNYTVGSYWFPGNIGPVHIYNRALSSNEVLYNYNALKGRFGL